MILVQNLICEFPDGEGKKLRALSVPSFSLEDGGLAVITGPSGTGKTTFLHCLSGMLTPSYGDITIGDVQLTNLSKEERCRFRAEKVGYVFQKPLLLSWLTVKENIRLSAKLAGRSADDDEIEGLLADVGLSGMGDRKTGHLSGGQQQRVSFLRAGVRHPSLLLADEPTASLDEENGKKLMDIMLDYQKKSGATLLCATHDKRVMDLFPKRYDVQKGGFLPC